MQTWEIEMVKLVGGLNKSLSNNKKVNIIIIETIFYELLSMCLNDTKR